MAFRFRESASNTATVDRWLLERITAGWTPEAIVAASGGRVSTRTVYRWRHDFIRCEEVSIGVYAATFAIRRGKPPIRVSPWRRM